MAPPAENANGPLLTSFDKECVEDCDALRWRHLELQIWRQWRPRGVRASKFCRRGAARLLRFNNKPARISGSGWNSRLGQMFQPLERQLSERFGTGRHGAQRQLDRPLGGSATSPDAKTRNKYPNAFTSQVLTHSICVCVRVLCGHFIRDPFIRPVGTELKLFQPKNSIFVWF